MVVSLGQADKSQRSTNRARHQFEQNDAQGRSAFKQTDCAGFTQQQMRISQGYRLDSVVVRRGSAGRTS